MEDDKTEEPEDVMVGLENSLSMYENLKMKNEFVRALRQLLLHAFQSTNWNLVVRLLLKYGQIEGSDKKMDEE